ncbi:MAG TPA: DUF2339 domain-containing protein [Gemmatimonadales bacterium]|nr:DUF2339 domain-containing protein [Gemmatimonadales bacterium]
MTGDQREAIEQLERRVATLEDMVRRLTFIANAPSVRRGPPATPPVVRASLPTVTPTESGSISTSRDTDLEQWFGQRGLLAVGVIALLAAGAFFLKYAFDRGWIPALVRSLLAIVAGLAVAAWGHERITRGMRRYGAALIGAGGGLAFLGLWAAAGPYGLVERRIGVLLLAATTVAVTVLALHHEIEGLAIWALAGAYLAPILLQPPVPNPNAFLGYLEVVGLGTGILAHTMTWRRTFDVALFGYVLLAASGAGAALATPTGGWLLAAAALLTLYVTRVRPWPEARVGVVLLTWFVIGASLPDLHRGDTAQWLTLGALAAITGLMFWQHLERDPFRVDTKDVAADQLLFIANPAAFVMLAFVILQHTPEVVPAALGAVYLLAGWIRRAAPFLIMGFALEAFALALGWPAASVTIGWTALALLALLAERQAGRPGGRQAAVGLATVAFISLFSAALWARAAEPVFTDSWALALYAYLAGTAAAARWWGAETRPTLWKGGGAEWCGMLCGAAVFAGGSIQFARALGRITALAGNLALSVWWLVFAGTLVWLGFRMDRKMIRSAGLIVAAGAGFKIVLYDLSTLQALYRVGSFFALALIALAVAYAYNRKARVSAV